MQTTVLFNATYSLTVVHSVYVDEAGRLNVRHIGQLYERLGIREQGIAMLVRPDTVVAMATAINAESVKDIQGYFARL